VRKADNLTTSCAVVTKSGNLNFLEPSGHLGPATGQIYLLPSIFTQNFGLPFFRCFRIFEVSRLFIGIELLIEYWGLLEQRIVTVYENFGWNVTKIKGCLTRRPACVSAQI